MEKDFSLGGLQSKVESIQSLIPGLYLDKSWPTIALVVHLKFGCPIRRKRPVDSEQSGRVPWPSERLQGTR